MARPRKFDSEAVPVSVRLPERLHDALIHEALRRQIDLSDLMREQLSRGVLYLKTSAQ